MCAHHQRGLAGRHLLQHLLPALALAAAAEPRHGDAQRRQPADQLAEMLFGEDLGGRHQRALPALLHGNGGGERGHHRLARAHVALQQAVHRDSALQVVGDLAAHAALRRRQRERQRSEQPVLQAAGRHRERRRALQFALALGLQLRQLLRQQFLELQALPGRVAAVFERGQAHAGRRVVQEVQRIAQGGHARRHRCGRQQLRQVGARQPRRHGLAQVGLRQLRARRVHRRQRRGQRRVGGRGLHDRVHHLQPEEAAARVAPHAHALAHRQRLLLRGVEVQEAQHQVVAAGVAAGVVSGVVSGVITQAHHQLPARAHLHLAGADHAFDLRMLAIAQRGDGRDARFVFVAHRQVQRQVDGSHQAELVHRLLWR